MRNGSLFQITGNDGHGVDKGSFRLQPPGIEKCPASCTAVLEYLGTVLCVAMGSPEGATDRQTE